MKLITNLLFYLLAAMLFLFFAMAIITTPIEAKTLTNDLEQRLAQYRQMYFELEFSADVEELEYLQRKIARLEREAEEFGACPLTFDLSSTN